MSSQKPEIIQAFVVHKFVFSKKIQEAATHVFDFWGFFGNVFILFEKLDMISHLVYNVFLMTALHFKIPINLKVSNWGFLKKFPS